MNNAPDLADGQAQFGTIEDHVESNLPDEGLIEADSRCGSTSIDFMETVDTRKLLERVPRMGVLGLMRVHLVDWIAVLTLLLGFSGFHFFFGVTDRYVLPNDPAFSMPERPDTVSSIVLTTVAILFSFVCLVQAQIMMNCIFGNVWWIALDVHHFCLGLLESFITSTTFTIFIKEYVGMYRPSGFECKANGHSGYNMSYVSGHTSTAFCFMVYISLYLCGKLGLFSRGGHLLSNREQISEGAIRDGLRAFRGSFAALTVVVLLPIGFATFVGASRIVDFAHARPDVNGGVLVGSFSAFLAYFINWPPLTDAECYLCRPLQYEVVSRRRFKNS